MEVPLIHCAHEHKDGVHLRGVLREPDTLTRTSEQNVEGLLTLYYDVGDGEAGTEHRTALFFPVVNGGQEVLRPDAEVEQTTVDLLTEAGTVEGLIVGITEDVPQDRWQGSFRAIMDGLDRHVRENGYLYGTESP